MGFAIPPEKIENRHFINGEFFESSDKKTFPLISPYTREKVVDVCEASIDDTNRAVAAAKAALPAWAGLDPNERGAYLRKLAGLLRGANTELAQLEAMSMGRPISTYFDGYFSAAVFEHNAEAAYYAKGETSLNTKGYVNLTFRQPIGPVAMIIPWNAPILFFGMKVAPAVAAGCTVVLKSSEKAPLTSAKVAHLVKEAGFPPGVINIIGGHGMPAGQTLSEHMDIRMVNFTGSTATGKKIQEAAARSNLKRVVLELGGKSPAIVFEDADIARAAAETMVGISMMMGQVCIANSRIYVQEGVRDEFMETFKALFKAQKKGDPLLPETQQGPQADHLQWERIKGFLKTAKTGGGKLELGGEAVHVDGKGYFVEPTIYSGVAEDHDTQREEVFGPFVNINTFRTEEEVMPLANNTEYGLYASVWTKDISRALRVAKAFESGTVAVNCTGPSMGIDMPFGGYKGSGQGREGYGYSLEEYLETKAVLIKIGDDAVGGVQVKNPEQE
ncbi:aldehyde dehydrogenase [Polychaeton citri CBS 116435]|uniref:aldehyde dehydrogenase (NAD(+)) n=1 Tax=Polychaeton citri CBS 116435 TaxID=1314669 RepID=A0A9P4QF65_9PEZI|nr:aldehyde dehydrogenase [Polychaeton citri CBS 116435]